MNSNKRMTAQDWKREYATLGWVHGAPEYYKVWISSGFMRLNVRDLMPDTSPDSEDDHYFIVRIDEETSGTTQFYTEVIGDLDKVKAAMTAIYKRMRELHNAAVRIKASAANILGNLRLDLLAKSYAEIKALVTRKGGE